MAANVEQNKIYYVILKYSTKSRTQDGRFTMNEISSHLQQDGPYIYILLTDLLCMNSHHKRTSDSTFDFNSISIWKSLNTCENAEDKPTGRGYVL